ncbi:FAD-dependent oxidoreductase [Halomonas sp. M5N1S17]|uniref:NAD(P)/FAD-dependent oxidoreductase n=1 Tax=Halomonas alkalisoli TaxID=2907158 RepID=UPI001F2515BE|nr:FAD-dependent oxidoreductase [Halomonas alkalisoli]MCE9662996.1 FAD-dependent oxidoreductase [Halomonas alkalisoli]
MSPPTRPTAAIIGAGIAGLACARVLQAAGWQVTLFEKARGPGGRMTSRSLAAATVDIGAQFFSVRDEAFRREAETWLKAGLIAPWPWKLWRVTNDGWHYRHDGRERYAGKPRMSAVTRHLSRGLALEANCRIVSLARDTGGWSLQDQARQHHGPFDHVVITAPSPQAQALVAPHDSRLTEACEGVIQRPCWAAWACFDRPLATAPGVSLDWQAVMFSEGPLRFVARNDHKPGREQQGESLTLLARLEWSEAHLEMHETSVADSLLTAFRKTLPDSTLLPAITAIGAHRWRYAQPDVFAGGEAVNRDYRLSTTGLALCGDGWRGPRVEDAWLSGHHLGHALAAQD